MWETVTNLNPIVGPLNCYSNHCHDLSLACAATSAASRSRSAATPNQRDLIIRSFK